ncbi:MAG: ATP-grasp domain-containing protein [Paludibacteraceae bacterium]|nr:ATP-grasp domain-containing protein [Paludibacteraceae bacterium]
MKKLLILGAGIYQVPLIQTANRMGIHTIVCSRAGNYPGFDLADETAKVDTTDTAACLQLAKDAKIDGVITAGTDVALPSLGLICDTLGLPGPSAMAAHLSSNKKDMKEAFHAFGVRSARYQIVHNLDGCLSAAKTLSFPLILKVVDSSGSRGIVVVRTEEDIRAQFNSLWANTHQDYVLIEEFIEGEEFGAQALVTDGRVRFVMPHEDYVYQAKTGVPIGHAVPCSLSAQAKAETQRMVEGAVRALRINNAAVNVDLIRRDDKVYVLEVGARSGATGLSELVSQYYGVDYYECLIRMALGESLDDVRFLPSGAAAVRLLYTKQGGVLQSFNKDIAHPSLVSWSLDYAIGEKLPAFTTGPDRIGQIVVKTDSAEQLQPALSDIIQQIDLKIKHV